MNAQKNRLAYIDLLKTLAIISVIIIHSSVKGVMLPPALSGEYCYSLFFSTLARFAVPVFLMCSGALFLNMNKTVTVKSIYTKYIPRIAGALALFAVFYTVFMIFLNKIKTGIFDVLYIQTFVKNLFTFNTHYHLYYLYIIIIIYAVTPILRTFLKSATKRNINYLMAFLLFFYIIVPFIRTFPPFNTYFTGMTLTYHINTTYGMVLYYLAGYYLNTYEISKKTRNILVLLSFASFWITYIATYAVSLKNGYLYEALFAHNTPNIFFYSIGLFVFVKHIKINSPRLQKLVLFISKSSFCVYLIHDAFLNIFDAYGFNMLTFTPFISLPLLVAAIFASSVVVYMILRKIPIINKIVH